MNEDYREIMDLPHHKSVKHKPMPRLDRAAQFASFAALSGHGDMVKEEARLTDEKAKLSEEEEEALNAAFARIAQNIHKGLRVKFKVFEPDPKKQGGKYEEKEMFVRKVDFTLEKVISRQNEIILFENIVFVEIITTENE